MPILGGEMKRIFPYFVIIFVLLIGLNCGGGSGGSGKISIKGTSPVTITMSFKKTSKTNNTSLKEFATKIIDIRYTVTGADMEVITGTVPVVGDVVEIALSIPNGLQRHFLLEALDNTGFVLYKGDSYADLNGTPVTILITLVENILDISDNFDDGTIAPLWNLYPTTGLLFEEKEGTLSLAGTLKETDWSAILTMPYPRQDVEVMINFRAPTGIQDDTASIFRIQFDFFNYFQIQTFPEGYRLVRVLDNQVEAVGSPLPLFGDETTKFHKLKLRYYDKTGHVEAYIDNIQLDGITDNVFSSSFPDFQFAFFSFNVEGQYIKHEWDNFSASRAGIDVVFNDDFNDNSLSSFWTSTNFGSGPTISETNQRLQIFFPSNASDDSFGAGYNSNCLLRRDFDVQVDYNLMTWPSENGIRVGLLANWVDTVERVSFGEFDFPGEPREAYLTSFADGYHIIPAIDNSGQLRIIRSGNTMYGYYSNYSGWTLISSGPALTSGTDVQITIAAWSHDYVFADQVAMIVFDNFIINSGELACP